MQPIIGCEIALDARRCGERQRRRLGRAAAEPDRIVLLVQSEAGYRNLLQLVSQSFLDGEAASEPAIALADARGRERRADLPHRRRRRAGRAAARRRPGRSRRGALLSELAAAFPGRLYVELMRHGMPEEARSEAGLVDLAYRHDLPLVATNDAYFPDRDFYEAHDALLCIAQGTVVADADRRRLTARALLPPGGGDAGALRRSAGGLRQHAGDRPALRLHPAAAQADPAGLPEPRRARTRRARCARAARAGLDARLAQLRRWRGSDEAAASPIASGSNSSST